MKKSMMNIIIDALSLLVFMSMISTGLLLKFVLPPGSGSIERLFRGGKGQEKTIDVFMSLSRHEWGEIHFYISLAFVILLAVHLFLHWDWIVAMSFGTKNRPQSHRRKVMMVGILLFVVFSLTFPWIVGTKTLTRADVEQAKLLEPK